MVALLDLWLPILLSAVFVFLASSVIHMATPMHKSDYKKLPNEADVMDSLRPHGVPRGLYMFPNAGSFQEMGTPEYMEKLERGPVGHMMVLDNGPFPMGKALGQWFVLSIVISVAAAFVASLAIAPGAEGMVVAKVTGVVALCGYGLANATDSIWKGVPWGVTFRFLVDGVIYAAATGATFCWLWPGA